MSEPQPQLIYMRPKQRIEDRKHQEDLMNQFKETFRDVKCNFEDLDGLKWSPEDLKKASKSFIPPSRSTITPQPELPPSFAAQTSRVSPATGKVTETQSLDGVLSIIYSKDKPHAHNTLGDRTNSASDTTQSQPSLSLDGPDPAELEEATPRPPTVPLPDEENSPFEPPPRPRGRSSTRTHSRTFSRTTSYRHIDSNNPENSVRKGAPSSVIDKDAEKEDVDLLEKFAIMTSKLLPDPVADRKGRSQHSPAATAPPLEEKRPLVPRDTAHPPLVPPRGRSSIRTPSRLFSRTTSFRHNDSDNAKNNVSQGTSSTIDDDDDAEKEIIEYLETFPTVCLGPVSRSPEKEQASVRPRLFSRTTSCRRMESNNSKNNLPKSVPSTIIEKDAEKDFPKESPTVLFGPMPRFGPVAEETERSQSLLATLFEKNHSSEPSRDITHLPSRPHSRTFSRTTSSRQIDSKGVPSTIIWKDGEKDFPKESTTVLFGPMPRFGPVAEETEQSQSLLAALFEKDHPPESRDTTRLPSRPHSRTFSRTTSSRQIGSNNPEKNVPKGVPSTIIEKDAEKDFPEESPTVLFGPMPRFGPVAERTERSEPAPAAPLEENHRNTTHLPSVRPRPRRTFSRNISYRHIDSDNPKNNVPKGAPLTVIDKDAEQEDDDFLEKFATMTFGPLSRFDPVADRIERSQTPTSKQQLSFASSFSSSSLEDLFYSSSSGRSTPTQMFTPDSGDDGVTTPNAATFADSDKRLLAVIAEPKNQEQEQAKPWRPLSFKERYGATFTSATKSPITTSESEPELLDADEDLPTLINDFDRFLEEDDDALYEQLFDAMERQVDEELGIVRRN